MKIGNLKLKNNLILAPMADITDVAFRLLCKRNGAGLVFTEMIHAEALVRKNEKTLELIKTCEEERPVGIQLAVNDIKTAGKIIPSLKKFDVVDINCGCPAPKITKNNLGAALLEKPEKINEIIKFLVKNLDVPITAKIRLGFNNVNVFETAKAVEDAGASAITIHARLASSRYNVKADWDWIKKVRDDLDIPVIGNGDVFNGKDAEELLKKCDGVMIARGAIGDPLIFKRILYYFENGEEMINNKDEKIGQFFEYVDLCKKFRIFDFKKIRKASLYYLKDFNDAARIRDNVAKSENINKLKKCIVILK